MQAQVPRTRSSRTSCGKCDRELRVQRGTRIIELLVVLRFRGSYMRVRQDDTNFGIAPLVYSRQALRHSVAEPSEAAGLHDHPLACTPGGHRLDPTRTML